MRTRSLSLAAMSLSALFLAGPALGGPGGESKKGSKGADIGWARSFAEAKEEAAERNVAMFLHSHGST